MISRRLLRIKVLKGLYGYIGGQRGSLVAAEKELALSIRKTYDQYNYLFWFVPLLQDLAIRRIDLGLQKHLPSEEELNPNTKFAENKVIKQISENAALIKFAEQNSVIMTDAASIIRKMYRNITKRDYFKEYMNDPVRSFAGDRRLVIDILETEFEDFEDLYNMLEEQSIYWTDEPEFVVSVIIKTVKTIRQDKPFELFPLFKNSDDAEFGRRLLRHAILNYDEYNETVDKFTPNWDLERIAFMDKITIVSAMSEIMEFPNIPVKVTLDEYIDLARYYSTPGSSVFVNGVLDRIVWDFGSKNLIRKEGSGLIDTVTEK